MQVFKEFELSESTLIEGMRNDDEKSFESVFRIYGPELYKKAVIRMKDQTEAEDLVQDIFADIWERRRSLIIESSLRGYLHKALKYKIIKWSSRLDMHHEAVADMLNRIQQMENVVLEVIAAGDLNKTISAAIHTFPENMQKVFLMRQQDYTIAEVAKALGLATQTVKNNNSEALRRLKIVLEEKHPELSRTLFLAFYLLIEY